MALSTVLLSPAMSHPILTILLLPAVYLLIRSIYRISGLHPLSKLPGPLFPRISSLWLTYHAWIGDEASLVENLHQKFGAIVVTGPNSVDISDGAALQAIYNDKGGFRKADFYANFDNDGHKTLFSATDPSQRAPKAKVVVSAFSTTNLRLSQDVIYKCSDAFVRRMKEGAKNSGKPLNLLTITRSLAVDTVSSYLLGRNYNALGEHAIAEQDKIAESKQTSTNYEHEFSAGKMVNLLVETGRFWYVPEWAYKYISIIDNYFNMTTEVDQSFAVVDKFVSGILDDAEAAVASDKPTDHPKTSFPARLLTAGFSRAEARTESLDLIQAGTDSSGMNLATILWELVRHPECYARLREELLNSNAGFDDVQSLPYLRGVVKEGLRISMANPSRFPRVVPPGGWVFKDTFLPGGTVVSCTPLSLHFNTEIFPDPWKFKPERWLDATDEMNRNAIPFGLGSRQCIARNLATVELYCAVEKVVKSDVLRGARTLKDKIEIREWFNSQVVGERIDLVWD